MMPDEIENDGNEDILQDEDLIEDDSEFPEMEKEDDE